MTTVAELSEILQQLLIDDANRIGKESGFIQRQRKLSGASFAQSLVFGWQANPKASLEELCQSARLCGVTITPQGLQDRLNSKQAHQFLQQLLLQGIGYVVQTECERKDLLQAFTGVYIQDSSRIELPSELATYWSGNGGKKATLKVQAVMDYGRGALDVTLAPGRAHDCPLQTVELPKGSLRSLRLADLGYFKAAIFKQLTEQGVWWVSRLPVRAGIWQDDRVITTLSWLAAQPQLAQDCAVEITAQRLPCRLLAIPVPADVAHARRQRVRKAAKARRHSKLRSDTVDLCDWTILITNLPADAYSADDILCLQRLRWQIELLFKLWKQDLSVDEWRSQQPDQILTEVYAKLLLALIQHWFLILGCWQQTNRSLAKAASTLRKHAFHVLSALPSSERLLDALLRILPTLARCTVQKRKAHPATFQLLACASP